MANTHKPAAQIGTYRIVPNLASEQAETINAFSANEAMHAFTANRPGVEIHDVILLKCARFPVVTTDGRGWMFVTVPD